MGWEGEAETVAGLRAQYRMVTVTGPGGVGKTRPMGEVAPQVASQFADGVWLVELAGVRNPAHVPIAVAAALRLLEAPSLSVPGEHAGATRSVRSPALIRSAAAAIVSIGRRPRRISQGPVRRGR